MDWHPLPPAPPPAPPAEQHLALLQGKLTKALIETACASLSGGLQDLLQSQEELAATLATIDDLHGSPVIEIVDKAQAVIRELLIVVEALQQGTEGSQEEAPTTTRP